MVLLVILTVRVRKLPGGMPRGGAPLLLLLVVVPDVEGALVVSTGALLVTLLEVLVELLVVDSVVEEGPPVVVVVDPDIPLLGPPRAKEDKAEATAAEAAWASPPARLPFIAPIIGGGMDAGTIVAGSILEIL